MQLHEAYEVKEVYCPKDANAAIQMEGWKLLAVTAVTNPTTPQFVSVCYVLGKHKPISESSIN